MSPQMRKGERPRPNFAQLGALGALGACGPFLLLMLAFFFFTRPGATVMDGENITIAWIGVGGLLAAVIAVHVMIGLRMMKMAKGVRERP